MFAFFRASCRFLSFPLHWNMYIWWSFHLHICNDACNFTKHRYTIKKTLELVRSLAAQHDIRLREPSLKICRGDRQLQFARDRIFHLCVYDSCAYIAGGKRRNQSANRRLGLSSRLQVYIYFLFLFNKRNQCDASADIYMRITGRFITMTDQSRHFF